MSKLFKINNNLKYLIENKVDITIIKDKGQYIISYDTLEKGPYNSKQLISILKQLEPKGDIDNLSPNNIIKYIDKDLTQQIDLTVNSTDLDKI